MTVKFNTKNVTLLGKAQVSEGTPVNPTASDAIAIISNDSDTTRETDTFQYLGDSQSRDEVTTVKDTFGTITFESFMPILGALDAGLVVADAPYDQWFQACGGKMIVAASSQFDNGGNPVALQDGEVLTATDGAVLITNQIIENSLLTIDYLKSSPETTGGKQKRYRYSDCRGYFDLSFTAGERIKLAFTFMGNNSEPTMETAITPDFGTQKLNIGSVVRLQNMQQSTIQEVLGTVVGTAISNIVGNGTTVTVTSTGHGLLDKEYVTITGTTNYNIADKLITYVDANTFTYLDTTSDPAETSGTATKAGNRIWNLCVDGINAPNTFGFDYERYLLTCQEGFDKTGAPTDVTVTTLEDEVGGTDFNPESNLEKYFKIKFKYGTGAGKYVRIIMDKVQLSNVSDSSVGNFFGKECTFRNTSHTFIILE